MSHDDNARRSLVPSPAGFALALAFALAPSACGGAPEDVDDAAAAAGAYDDDDAPAALADDGAAVPEDDGEEPSDLVDDAPDLDEPDDLPEPIDAEDDLGGGGDDEATVHLLAAGARYTNDLGPHCADPGIIKIAGADGPTFWVACTGANYPLFKSRDLVHWSAAGHLFTHATRPTWSGGDNWAPEIHKIGNHLVAYFTALSTSRGRKCIGAATASSMQGPWHDLGHPLVCDGRLSLIDPNVYTDGATGKHYLYVKTDGNAQRPKEKTILYGQRLRADGLGLVGKRHALLRNTLSWEGDVVEAPWVMHRGGYYYMFYSGFTYCNATYGVGIARSRSPLGPFTKKSKPILHSNATWAGPGHNSFVRAGGAPWLVYHAWDAPHACTDGGSRKLLIDRVRWSGGWPAINNGTPSVTSRAAP